MTPDTCRGQEPETTVSVKEMLWTLFFLVCLSIGLYNVFQGLRKPSGAQNLGVTTTDYYRLPL